MHHAPDPGHVIAATGGARRDHREKFSSVWPAMARFATSRQQLPEKICDEGMGA
jgi:hypothetical protein